MLKDLISTIVSIPKILEIVAAVVATIYYFQEKVPENKTLKYLSLFLWLTVITELLGSYTSIICYYKMDESLFLINDSKWLKNYWIFNV